MDSLSCRTKLLRLMTQGIVIRGVLCSGYGPMRFKLLNWRAINLFPSAQIEKQYYATRSVPNNGPGPVSVVVQLGARTQTIRRVSIRSLTGLEKAANLLRYNFS